MFGKIMALDEALQSEYSNIVLEWMEMKASGHAQIVVFLADKYKDKIASNAMDTVKRLIDNSLVEVNAENFKELKKAFLILQEREAGWADCF